MKAERRNVTNPPDWWVAFEIAAAKDGATLSEWIGAQCVRSLPKKVQRALADRPPAHRPKKAT